VTGQCVAQIADPDKVGRLVQCDRPAQHAGPHHARDERGDERTWGVADQRTQTPRPSESLTDAYLEHTRAVRAQRDEPSPAAAERVRAALDAVTREEAAYAAECIAAGVPPVARPLPLDGIGS
jgi:hypothetical protein